MSWAVATSPVLAQIPASAGFEDREAEQFVRSLLSEHRYREAISYLQSVLEARPPDGRRLPLLLLLADGMLRAGDLAGAEDAIRQAQTLLPPDADEDLLADRLMALESLRAGSPDSVVVAASGLDEDLTEGEPALEAPAAMGKALVNNSFFDTDLRQVLSDVSLDVGVPILWDASVEGLITYDAVDQPLDEVLKAVLFPLGYTFVYENGVCYVGSADPEGPAFGILSKTEVVALSNLAAKEAIGLLADVFQEYVKSSETSNLVCITAPPTLLARIRADLQAIDTPQDLILIEVILSEISTHALREMGLDWSLKRVVGDSQWDVGTDHTSMDAPALVANFADLGASIGGHAVDLTTSLEALVQSGDASIRANPHITTLNGRLAEINLTQEQYFIIQTGGADYFRYNTLESVSSGVKLEITPFASSSGEVTVFVKTEVGDVVGKGENDLPEISRREASTTVRVRDGGTFTIGGLGLRLEKQIRKKVPILGSIPLLGYFFRYEETRVEESEIVIFITPHILKR